MKIPISEIKKTSLDRPKGYYDDVMSRGEISEEGEYLLLGKSDFIELREKYNPQPLIETPVGGVFPPITFPKEEPDVVKEQMVDASGPPSALKKVASFAEAVGSWAKQGFPISSDALFESRVKICNSCDLWNPKSFGGSGSCMSCGCSTQAKLRMETEKCPLGKW